MGALLRGTSKVTSRGQITVPQDIRKEFQIKAGDMVYFLVANNKIILRTGPLEIH